MDKRPEAHFKKPRMEHTKIKHHLFSETLKVSLYIANNMARNNKYMNFDSYAYIDLFAGSGKFKDDSKGSPLIAVDIAANHLKYKGNVFNKIDLIFIEKDKQNADDLKKNVGLELKKYNLEILKNLRVQIGDESWEKYDIEKILNGSTWGFIFADPFSTELKLDNLKTTLKNCSKYKDILIFANFNTLARQYARGHNNDIQRICEFLGISENKLQENIDFPETFIELLKNKFKSIKDFSIGVAIPISVEQKLRAMDYFYLVLFTSSVMVGNMFLESYEKEIEQYRSKEKSLFCNQDDEPLLGLIKENKELSLYKIWEYYQQNFLSWKKIVNDSNLRVPTLKNITDIINNFKNNCLLEIVADEKYFYKKSKNKIGNIKPNDIRSMHDLKSIKIKNK